MIDTTNLKVVTAGKNTYLADVTEGEGKITLTNAAVIGDPLKNADFDEWIKRANRGTLGTVEVSSAQGYTITELTKSQTFNFKIKLITMEDVKGYALAKLENKYYNGRVSKR